jgi:hypothetical protein
MMQMLTRRDFEEQDGRRLTISFGFADKPLYFAGKLLVVAASFPGHRVPVVQIYMSARQELTFGASIRRLWPIESAFQLCRSSFVISCDRKPRAYRMRGPLGLPLRAPRAGVGWQGTWGLCLLAWLRKIVDCGNLRMFLGL